MFTKNSTPIEFGVVPDVLSLSVFQNDGYEGVKEVPLKKFQYGGYGSPYPTSSEVLITLSTPATSSTTPQKLKWNRNKCVTRTINVFILTRE